MSAIKKIILILSLIFILNPITNIRVNANEINTEAVYVDGVNGNDDIGDGLTPETAVKSLSKAYEKAINGGTIFIVNKITVNKKITLDKTYYKEGEVTINIPNNKEVMIKRYVQPTLHESLTNFSKESYLLTMIEISSDGELTLEDIIIDGHNKDAENISASQNAKGVDSNGQIIVNGGILIVNNAEIRNNTYKASNLGSGIYNTAKCIINNGKIHDNKSSFGAGILSSSKLDDGLVIKNGEFYNNTTSKSGAALYIRYNGKITGGKYYNNTADASHIYIEGVVEMSNVEIYDNIATGSGGGIFVSSDGGKLLVRDSKIYNNIAKKFGGAIYANGNITVIDTEIYGNEAIDGGAITAMNLTVQGGKIYNNTATGNGGAIECYDPVSISGVEIYGNSAINGGGIWSFANLDISNVNIHDNTATGNGNGIYSGKNLIFKDNVKVDNNDIYLEDGTMILVSKELPENAEYLITPSDYTIGRVCVTIEDESKLASEVYSKFKLTPKDEYNLRPGDLNTKEEIKDNEIIISELYKISYVFENDEGKQIEVPDTIQKYWYEKATISTLELEKIGLIFEGWENRTDDEIEVYFGLEDITNINENMVLHATYKADPDYKEENNNDGTSGNNNVPNNSNNDSSNPVDINNQAIINTSNPKTSDNITIYVIVFIMALTLGLICIFTNKKIINKK